MLAETREERRRLWIDLALFTGLAFGLTWLIMAAYIFAGPTATAILGPMKFGAPAFFAAVYVPSLAGIVVSALRHGGKGLADLFGALARGRVSWPWIALSMLTFPGLWALAQIVGAAAGDGWGQLDLITPFVALAAILLGGDFLRDPGALGEELGWRGFALPRLLAMMSARSAAILLGLVWAVWHIPAFFVPSLSQSNLNFAVFVIVVTVLSIFMTWIFVNTRGSILWAGVVPHIVFNAAPKAEMFPAFAGLVMLGLLILVLGGKELRGIGRPKAVLPQFSILFGSRL